MFRELIRSKDLNEIMGLLHRVLDIRITFFDLQGHEQDSFDIKEMTPFCRNFRQDPDNDQRCHACDLQHLQHAKETQSTHIYHCHKGLLEGVVPLFNRQGVYIGAIFFGQLRDRNYDFRSANREEERLYTEIKALTIREIKDIGELLKLVSEYIIENEMIKSRNKPWAELLEDYITTHLDKRISLQELADLTDRSPSFLSHNFHKEFGLSPKQYILQKKMKCARTMICRGESVRNTALALGFYDEFHFSKAFKGYWKKSPKQFKL